MASKPEPTVEPEAWLRAYVVTMLENQASLREGVLVNATFLLRSIECGPLPGATLRISNGCFMVHWSNRQGDSLSLSFVGPQHFRYRHTTGKGKDSGSQIVKSRHVERLRRLVAKVFDVNHNFADSIHFELRGKRI